MLIVRLSGRGAPKTFLFNIIVLELMCNGSCFVLVAAATTVVVTAVVVVVVVVVVLLLLLLQYYY